MPFVSYQAKKVVLDQPAFAQVVRMTRSAFHTFDNFSIGDVYRIIDDEVNEKFSADGTLIIMLKVNGNPETKFVHLWGERLKGYLNTFNPTFEETSHRVRIDNRLCLDGNHDVYYERYKGN